MKKTLLLPRRAFLKRTGGLAAALAAPAGLLAEARNSREGNGKKREEAGVSPPEDLMREHGVLSRILLIYEEILRRLAGEQAFQPEVLSGSARLIRRFIEDYHEKLEEEYLFPRFEKAGRLIGLVEILKEQHQAGRRLTELIQKGSTSSALSDKKKREEVSLDMHLFIRMYRPHKAREDTVLFPAVHSLLPPDEFEKLGDQFEYRENALFGENGFNRIVSEVAGLEKKLGLYDLSRFTPPEPDSQER